MSAPLLPDQVRADAAGVAERSEHVRLRTERIAAYADTLPPDRACHPSLQPGDLPPLTTTEALASWVLTVNAINHGSGFFPHLRKRPGLSGSRTIFAELRDHVAAHGPCTPAWLAEATEASCTALFGQDPTGPAGELMRSFASSWQQLGAAVTATAGTEDPTPFTTFLARADGSAPALAELLAEVGGWDDRSTHLGHPVALFKRAQIVAAHLAMAQQVHPTPELTPVRDLDRLTIFADNLVPHVLRVDGILETDPELVARIDREELLVSGEPAEVELRALAVHAAELLVQELRRRGHPATAMGVDQILWARGAGARYKARPRHRARTTAY